MAKEKRVKIYNKGNRGWTITDGGEEITLGPDQSVELSKKKAESLVADYPREFMLGEYEPPKSASLEIKGLKAKISELEKENAELKELIESDTKPVDPVIDQADKE